MVYIFKLCKPFDIRKMYFYIFTKCIIEPIIFVRGYLSMSVQISSDINDWLFDSVDWEQ